jgi:hypothetical protein
MPTYERPATKNDLKAVRQYKGEMLRQYIQRFSQMRNKIPRISNEEVISAFSMGVSDIKMREKLSVNDELTSVVKTRESHTFIEDLEETFANLRKVNIKLNPAKCAFSVPSGKLLGFLVSHHGIEANPDKLKAIEEMRPPRNLKEMQCLAGCMAALGRFIARSGEKALPFFKLMKHTEKFEWTPEADKAFAELKRYLTSPPIMVAPTFHEPLLLYIAATLRTASAVLVMERDAKVIAKEGIDPPCPGAPHEVEAAIPPIPHEEPPAATSPTELLSQSDAPKLEEEKTPEDTAKVQKPVYFVSMVLRDARECYTMQQKLIYTLLIASRKLRHYFQGHPIMVVTDRPLETILCNPNVTGRVAEWAVELQPFEISFETTKVIKSQAFAEFKAEWTDPFADEPPEEESMLSMDFVSQEHGVPRDGPKDSNAGG